MVGSPYILSLLQGNCIKFLRNWPLPDKSRIWGIQIHLLSKLMYYSSRKHTAQGRQSIRNRSRFQLLSIDLRIKLLVMARRSWKLNFKNKVIREKNYLSRRGETENSEFWEQLSFIVAAIRQYKVISYHDEKKLVGVQSTSITVCSSSETTEQRQTKIITVHGVADKNLKN